MHLATTILAYTSIRLTTKELHKRHPNHRICSAKPLGKPVRIGLTAAITTMIMDPLSSRIKA